MSEDIMSNKTNCASCGIAEVDEVNLKDCVDCDLVRYCSDECRRDHNSQHNEACKKRVAELRDELLFKQPESSHLGDCPICCLPMPLNATKYRLMACCSKHFPTKTKNEAENEKYMMKRVEANDPVAMRREGRTQDDKGDYISAFEYYTKAAELGNADAHYSLSCLYRYGHGVVKDKGKEIHHLEEAAIGGHPDARFNLGCDEGNNGNIERARRHWIISANLGDDGSIKALMEMFKRGFVEKEVLAAALRAHQAAVDATKSPQRDAAEEFY
eukprot:scaffold16716_cov146-Skeletonema_dohrnii-CCMP3373.AAC.12